MPRVPAIARLFEYDEPFDNGGVLYVNKESYKNFVDSVIDKNVPWNDVVNGMSDMGIQTPQNIPGTWSWLSKDETATFNKGMYAEVGKSGYSSHAARMMINKPSGSSRKSRRIHRKPTKRRRNRRGNRKTKKN